MKTSRQAMDTLLDFFTLLENLKRTKRTGWINHKVPNPESISDHMHRMSVIALLLPMDTSIDRNKLIKMTIVHDIAEAVVGDIVPGSMPGEQKTALELKAMEDFSNTLGCLADEMVSLWKEYEEGITTTAIICKDIDKFEMILQAFEYEKDGHKLDQFFESTKGKFRNESIIKLAEELYDKRKHLHAFVKLP